MALACTSSSNTKDQKLTRTPRDKEISERARFLIDAQLGERGRFAMLEEMSGINTGQWKNFYYGRQLVNEQMLSFLRKKYPHDAIWLLTGERPPDQNEFPFFAPVPAEEDSRTIGQRLNWVIREWAAPKGKDLFHYLWEKSDEKITADEWARVVLALAEPTLEMVVVVCSRRPHFSEWVLLGATKSNYQVDPTSKASVAAWKAHKEADWKEFEKAVGARVEEFVTKVTKEPITQSRPKTTKKNGSKKG